MAEMRSVKKSEPLSSLADLLFIARAFGNYVDIPHVGKLGDGILGQSPEEIENWSYSNSPFQQTEMGLPQIKRERKKSLSDVLLTIPFPAAKAIKVNAK